MTTRSRAPFVATLTLPYPPSCNHRLAVSGGRLVKARALVDYQRNAGWEAKLQGATLLQGALCFYVDFYRPFRAGDPKRGGDLDNVLKALLDALTGIAYEDDSQIVEIHARRFDDKDNPRCEVLIQPLGSS